MNRLAYQRRLRAATSTKREVTQPTAKDKPKTVVVGAPLTGQPDKLRRRR